MPSINKRLIHAIYFISKAIDMPEFPNSSMQLKQFSMSYELLLKLHEIYDRVFYHAPCTNENIFHQTRNSTYLVTVRICKHL